MKFNYTNEDFIRYNANADNRDVGDCVRRAISLAYNIPYEKVRKDLFSMARKTHSSSKFWDVYETYIKTLGIEFYNTYKLSDGVTVDDITKEYPVGTLLIICQKNINSRTGHMVCAIDGDIYDSWDSRDAIVSKVFCVSGQEHAKRVDSTELSLEDYITESFLTACSNHPKLSGRECNIAIKQKSNLTTEVVTYVFLTPEEKELDNKLHQELGWKYREVVKNKFEVRTLKATGQELFASSHYLKFTPFSNDEEKRALVDNLVQVLVKELVKQINALQREFGKQEKQKTIEINPNFSGSKALLMKFPSWTYPYITGAYDDSYYDYDFNDRRVKYVEYTIYMNPIEGDPKPQYDVIFRGTINEIKRAMEVYKNTYERMNI